MQFSAEFFCFLIIQVLSAGIFLGGMIVNVKSNAKNLQDLKEHFVNEIGRLEKKQDKHNNLIERMCVVEQSCKSAHHRLDEIKICH